MTPPVEFDLNGVSVDVPANGSLLDALRESLDISSVKDGCSPQGQCGCCTVWVDGQPRVSCVTPVSRVRGRAVTTVEGLTDADSWAEAFCGYGASQCGFCTPGIIMRVAALAEERRGDADAVRKAMLAHLCRCTGWQPVVEAVTSVSVGGGGPTRSARDLDAASTRAGLEGGVPQLVSPAVALGLGGFADDTAPDDALVAVRAADGGWSVGETLHEARAASGKVQGRRTTAPLQWPIDVPPGEFVRTLQTTWVEPAYLEPDATWCEPGGVPMSTHGNGGSFGGKHGHALGDEARRLADEHGRPIRILNTREDVVLFGAKRPPMAVGLRTDGSGVVHVARTPGIADRVRLVAPDWEIVEIDVPGPPTSVALRGAGWAEVATMLASQQPGPTYGVSAPGGGRAEASVGDDGTISVRVDCGAVLDPTVLRSYCVGAAHMALGWVTSEGLSVDADGVPHDLTIRSFGIVRAIDTPAVDVDLVDSDGEPVNGSDAVFAAVAAAVWARSGWAPRWPVSP